MCLPRSIPRMSRPSCCLRRRPSRAALQELLNGPSLGEYMRSVGRFQEELAARCAGLSQVSVHRRLSLSLPLPFSRTLLPWTCLECTRMTLPVFTKTRTHATDPRHMQTRTNARAHTCTQDRMCSTCLHSRDIPSPLAGIRGVGTRTQPAESQRSLRFPEAYPNESMYDENEPHPIPGLGKVGRSLYFVLLHQ